MNREGMLALPRQTKPSNDKVASAPYNFVPLPEKVVLAADDPEKLPDHDTCSDSKYHNSGYIDVDLTVRSPLYIRGGQTPQDYDLDQQGLDALGKEINSSTPFANRIKNKPDFFHTGNPESPVIPGSSLRGMIRHLLGIASYGKLNNVIDKRLFFRTVEDTVVGSNYRDRMVGAEGGQAKVETGFMVRRGDRYVIRQCSMARVGRGLLSDPLYSGSGPNMTPIWQGAYYQYQTVWVKLSTNRRNVDLIQPAEGSGLEEAVLVITGNMQGKKREFVFLKPDENSAEVEVPETLIERFHDDDQITRWQETAFPINKPSHGQRERAGTLSHNLSGEGDPVFFLREDNALTFFGRAHMFRLPYTQTPREFVPKELRRPLDVDYADAMFGFVRGDSDFDSKSAPRQGSKGRAYASRVSVSDAHVTDSSGGLWFSEPFTPQILGTPKPTSFQHYLVQADDNPRSLFHYDSKPGEETVIRGHKLYWHQGKRTRDDFEDKSAPQSSTQHTRIKPVKDGVTFRFRIDYDNLSDEELGALCWTLHPLGKNGVDYCHSLGMGKPLGMGAVKLQATLHPIDRRKRYSSLFNGSAWETGETGSGESLSDRAALESLTKPFEHHVLTELGMQGDHEHLHELKRIGILLKMLEWEGFPVSRVGERFLSSESRPNTSYMALNDYRRRPVLPDPSTQFGEITGYAEPIEPARPAVRQFVSRNQRRSGQSGTSSPPRPSQPEPAPQGATTPLGDLLRQASQPRRQTRNDGRPRVETVSIVGEISNTQGQVRTEDGTPIPCTNFPTYVNRSATECRARVTRENGVAVSAVWERWA